MKTSMQQGEKVDNAMISANSGGQEEGGGGADSARSYAPREKLNEASGAERHMQNVRGQDVSRDHGGRTSGRLFQHMSHRTQENFDEISLYLAGEDDIRGWSYGEVKKSETINYRTFKPERDGLFCARIFGPVKDYECSCQKYRRIKHRGIVCEKCGVEVTVSRVRRERMGHIELAAPVAHIWYARSIPSRIGVLLHLTSSELNRILYYECYVVSDPGLTALNTYELLDEEAYAQKVEEYGAHSFQVMMGAEALQHMLHNLDLEALRDSLLENLESAMAGGSRSKILRRLELVNHFLASKTSPANMILSVLPVIPPDLRPLVPLDGGRFVSSDLNALYRRVIHRNNRLKRLLELQTPDVIVRNEKRMLQEAVDSLMGGRQMSPLKSLTDMLKGKQGIFRQNLLGKRVDYSGRSVIVVGPTLKLHQCGLPRKMALELFKPFVYRRLEANGLAQTLKSAKNMVDQEHPSVWDVLKEVVDGHPVLLNRAPTLHRLGIQAFEPVLTSDKSIQLHPLVCAAFNADFDGDQMAVHVPLSPEAIFEARVLMMSTENIMSPANGDPVMMPSKDIVLGLAYMSIEKSKEKGENTVVFDGDEAVFLYEKGLVALHAKVLGYVFCGKAGKKIRVQTTLGRMILSKILPEGMPFDLINQFLRAKEISQLVHWTCRHKKEDLVRFLDALKDYGFTYATQSGVSFGKDDLIVSDKKEALVEKSWRRVQEYQQQYLEGFITKGERYNKVTDEWSQCSDKVAKAMEEAMQRAQDQGTINSVALMKDSGARGQSNQIRQLTAMRGLMAKPNGEIAETPVVGNFKEGLTSLEYFISTHGARKGLSDTALKTANSGYLTRRLVDVAQDCVVFEQDCGTSQGKRLTNLVEGGIVKESLGEQALGRVLAEDVRDGNGVCVLPAQTLVEEKHVGILDQCGVDAIRVRSVLMCEASRGVCAKCYGSDLSRSALVNEGLAVGVIAAQSIGEPGTQLTMRTFHTGGAAQRSTEDAFVDAVGNGRVFFKNQRIVSTDSQGDVVMNRHTDLGVRDEKGRLMAVHRLPYGTVLKVKDGDEVKAHQRLAEWDAYTTPILSEKSGQVEYHDLQENISLRESMDEMTGVVKRSVMDWQQNTSGQKLHPCLYVKASDVSEDGQKKTQYILPPGAIIAVQEGQTVSEGDVLGYVSKEVSHARDITGGLPRIAELFEVRLVKDPALMSDVEGYIAFATGGRRRFSIIDEAGEVLKEYQIPKGKRVLVQEGDYVKKGEFLIDGEPNLQDILRISGVEFLAEYLIGEIQSVYRLQGVKINNKHIEVIIRQMLRKVEIESSGDMAVLPGYRMDYTEFCRRNGEIAKAGGREARAIPIILGITKAALNSASFVSAASFQETSKVLAEAAISASKDALLDIKSNVVVGKVPPCGTGHVMRQYLKQAKTMSMKDTMFPKEGGEDVSSGSESEVSSKAHQGAESRLKQDQSLTQSKA